MVQAMMDLIQITNDVQLAARLDAIAGIRIMVDLERMGKVERQMGRGSFISEHRWQDIARIRSVLRSAPLMVRLNPPYEGSAMEIEQALECGAQRLMLPMFQTAEEILAFCNAVGGRVPVTALLETAGALQTLPDWVKAPGLDEIFVGLNDLHLSLKHSFMFESVALGHLDSVAATCRSAGQALGFGGIARLSEGMLPGQDVLAEHVRLGSSAVILSRTFHRSDAQTSLEDEIALLRRLEIELALRGEDQIEADRIRISQKIQAIASQMRSLSPGNTCVQSNEVSA